MTGILGAAARGHAATRFSDQLVQAAGADWTAATEHPFTHAIGSGTMPRDAYVRYLIEDYTFITDLASVIGYLVAKAPDMAAKRPYAAFLALLTSNENDYFIRSFAALDVAPEIYLEAAQGPVTRAFASLLLEAAEASYEEGLACLLCAEWVYLTWGAREARKPRPADFWLAEWINLHAGPGFEGFVSFLRDEMDRTAARLTETERSRATERFVHMCALEKSFFDAAWNGPAGAAQPA
ncbi:TenA family protein [Pannonibacter sp. Q-1]